MNVKVKQLGWLSVVLGLALAIVVLPSRVVAQDSQDDPPTRVARLGYMEGSVSFQPAGEDEWVGAVPNRPMTTGDKLWADRDSKAELQLGSAVIRLSENTGVTFLNLDDHNVQLQLSSGTVNIRVRRLDGDDDFEIDTPNLAFTVSQPGSYRMEASEDGGETIIDLRAGSGQATGNGETYTLNQGQEGIFDGTDTLNADVEQIGEPDEFDAWADGRDHRWDDSPSAHYLSRDVVGYDDLDDNGDWRDDSSYGHIWYPHVDVEWAPYHTGHWAWIDPWGYTWVDDSPWGYAPFHYGRWVSVGGRWGWIAGPPAVAAVYAPALVVFIGAGGGWGGNIGWFPLGPREVWVPSYPVSQAYMTRVNVSNTTVSTTVITNVYNTTVINKTTNITNITYANRTVAGAVTAVPQNAFASAQPVAHAAVKVTPQQIAAAPVSARVAVTPTPQAVLGGKASSAGHVAAPPAAVMNRQVVAKKTPPPPPVPFAARQKALAAHPGVPVSRKEMATLRPASAVAAHPAVKVAPAGKPATATSGHPPAPRPGMPARTSQPARPGQPAPANRPGQPAPAQPNRPTPAQPNRPEANRPPAVQPKPEARPEENRPPAAQPKPEARPEPNRPPTAQPKPEARPEPNRPPAAQPKPAAPAPKPAAPAERPPQHAAPPPPAAKPAAKPAPPPAKKPQTPEEKKREEEKKPPSGE